ncbi:hypothetical protein PV08_01880 [Exophiala spinifera]|uniref:DUF985 domain-containing protein n=1 Tax=Exophiala spinifera TaxID=91928 RepID=A0A0D2BS88_9EURO|nr:uncharacterized protein PV08_01880 [Exophiala spinifera]KIW21300.1 hypothetical protein PV08_01880 [Exophiala spinifera]
MSDLEPRADNTTPPSGSSKADFLIKTLGLTYLPKESGYIGILGRSCHTVTLTPTTPDTALAKSDAVVHSSKHLAAQSHNYYMLTAEFRVNFLHFLDPDDTHILIEGGPVEYYTFIPPRHPSLSRQHDVQLPSAEKTILGRDYLAGQTPIISIPGGCWKALRLCEGVDYALMANVLAPEFTEDRVKIGAGQEFLDMFRGTAEWATDEFLRSLIANETWSG